MYQSINQNPFQQSQSPNQNESEADDEETPHNIKFTIPQSTNDKGKESAYSLLANSWGSENAKKKLIE